MDKKQRTNRESNSQPETNRHNDRTQKQNRRKGKGMVESDTKNADNIVGAVKQTERNVPNQERRDTET